MSSILLAASGIYRSEARFGVASSTLNCDSAAILGPIVFQLYLSWSATRDDISVGRCEALELFEPILDNVNLGSGRAWISPDKQELLGIGADAEAHLLDRSFGIPSQPGKI